MITIQNESWKNLLKAELGKDYFHKLSTQVDEAYEHEICYPLRHQIFAAFDSCPVAEVKVVIIGQDPYHGAGQANGLCFSVNDGVPFPPSLINIFKELNSDVGKEIPFSGNLESWAAQGVLLLNAVMTVQQSKPGSHKSFGWELFTNAVISKLSQEKKGLVFLLWGGYAKSKITLIDIEKHTVLTASHPSPLSANRGGWFGNKHFSTTNSILASNGLAPIQW